MRASCLNATHKKEACHATDSCAAAPQCLANGAERHLFHRLGAIELRLRAAGHRGRYDCEADRPAARLLVARRTCPADIAINDE